MTEIIIWTVVGMFVGWNLPQPWYAKYIQNRIVQGVKSITNR